MKRIIVSIVVSLAMLLGLSIGVATSVSAATVTPDTSAAYGAVYAMTNSVSPCNHVEIFNRNANGTLTYVTSVSTTGLGTGGTGLDPLASQGSLVLTPDGKWLLAANAGSNDITVFSVNSGLLSFVGRYSSGGAMPTSITVNGNEVVVLNSGSPNITGFTLSGGGVLSSPVWTRSLSGGFSQVGFNQLGNWLVVTDRADNQILVFSVNGSGTPAASPVVNNSNGAAPFGFIFDNLGRLLVVEAGSDAVSSYAILPNGHLSAISRSVLNYQVAACWIAGNWLGGTFTTNPGSGTISSYWDIFSGGFVTLLHGVAATESHPLDVGITKDGQFLYSLDPGNGGIDMFRINLNGSLTSLGTVVGGFAIYAQGLAVGAQGVNVV